MKRLTVVAGAAGGIGQVGTALSILTHSLTQSALTYIPSQPLSLLLKACPLVDKLALYDVVNTPGVATDLSHISSIAQIEGFLPAEDGMKKAFTGADIVVIPAGIPRKPLAIMVSHCKQNQELSIYTQASLA
jgi:malate/lactate dehydrogenase